MFDWSQAKKAVQEIQVENRPVILIVDDEAANRRVLGELLGNQYEAREAANGHDALTYLESDPGREVEALIIDHRMPGMTGVDLCKELEKRGNPIPRIMLTAYSELQDVISLVNEAGIFRYLPKPLEESVVREAVRQAVRSRKLEQENLKLIGIVSQLTAECEDFRAKLGHQHEDTKPEKIEPTHQGSPQKKTVTVICGDLRGFTKFSNEASPTIVISGLQAIIEKVHAIVYEQGGIIDKHNGDGFVAIFGLGAADTDDDGTSALRCVEELVNQYGTIRQKAFGEVGEQLCLGLGLARGEVLVGELGSEFRKDIVIFGDSMAIAERLQELTKVARSGNDGRTHLGDFSIAMAICPAELCEQRDAFRQVSLPSSITVREFPELRKIGVLSH